MIFLQIFKIITPVSDYLQTRGLDYAKAWYHISCASKSLKEKRNTFPNVIKAAENFVNFANEKIDDYTDSDVQDIIIQTELPKIRLRKKKKLPGELPNDEIVGETLNDRFRISVFNRIMDNIIINIEHRFDEHKDLYLDLQCYDPRRFKDLNQNLSDRTLHRISELIPSIDTGKLKEEILSFASSWCDIHTSENDDDSMFTKDEWLEKENSDHDENKTCNKCMICILRFLTEYNMHILQYSQLYKVYTYLLTLPLTQVSCERAFSKLKIIKTRLRSVISQEHLESFLIMQSERDMLVKVSGEKIIDKLCEQSKEMRRLLLP